MIYYSLCYLVFMNKTYRSPPTEQTQTPLITQSLPKDITGAGIMYFSQAPGSTNHFRRRSISTDVIELKEKNIAAIAVCLTHNDIKRLHLETYRETMEENNIQFIHCPIVDFWFPSDMELFNQQVENVYSYIQSVKIFLFIVIQEKVELDYLVLLSSQNYVLVSQLIGILKL